MYTNVDTYKLLLLTVIMMSPGFTVAQNENGFQSLFDGNSLNGWTVVNADPSCFQVHEPLLRVDGTGGWLKSDRQYSNFTLRAEFRFLRENSDSGIFIRTVGDTDFILGWPGNSYQVQTRDMSVNQTENPIWIGNIYRHRVNENGKTDFNRDVATDAYTGVDEWQMVEIEATGDTVYVHLNSQLVTTADNIINSEGFIGIQCESGLVEFRSIEIRES